MFDMAIFGGSDSMEAFESEEIVHQEDPISECNN